MSHETCNYLIDIGVGGFLFQTNFNPDRIIGFPPGPIQD